MILPAILAPSSSSGPAPYHADTVNVTPTDYPSIASATNVDSSKLTLFGWFKLESAAGPTFTFPFDFDPAGNENTVFFNRTQGRITTNVTDGSNQYEVRINGFTFDTAWHSFLITINVSAPDPDSLTAIYIDRVQQTISTLQITTVPIVIPINGLAVGVPDTPADLAVVSAGVANLIAWSGVSIVQLDGTISDADLDNFVTGENKPVNPTAAVEAYGTPLLRFEGDAATFGTNLGSAGSALTTGTLTNASTSPSD